MHEIYIDGEPSGHRYARKVHADRAAADLRMALPDSRIEVRS